MVPPVVRRARKLSAVTAPARASWFTLRVSGEFTSLVPIVTNDMNSSLMVSVPMVSLTAEPEVAPVTCNSPPNKLTPATLRKRSLFEPDVLSSENVAP